MTDTYLNKGKRGETYIREENGQQVLVKKRNDRSDVDTIKHETFFTQKVNAAGIGPQFIRYDESNNELIREYIEGVELRKWIETATAKQLIPTLTEILRQCRTLDKLRINKAELNHPWKDILITTKGPVMIDFERARPTETPKNVTQCCQFLAGTNMQEHYKKLNLNIDTAKITALAKKYKFALLRGKGEEEFSQLIEVIRDAN